MCGKFTQKVRWQDAVTPRAFDDVPDDAEETVTPMRFAGVVCRDAEGKRVVRRMRWGLVPADARSDLDGTKFIHARAETIERKPTFRDAFFNRRGLVAVNSFNEGREITPSRTEQYVITPRDRAMVAIAVIWERWQGPGPVALETFAMVTTPPNAVVGTIADRMPAVLDEADWPKWLGEEPATVDELKAMLKPSDIAMDLQKAGKPPPPPKPDSPQGSLF